MFVSQTLPQVVVLVEQNLLGPHLPHPTGLIPGEREVHLEVREREKDRLIPEARELHIEQRESI